MLFDEKTGALRPEATPTRDVTEVPGPFDTPQVPIGQLDPVSPPRKRKRKRRLAIDFNIKLTGTIMKKNFNNVDSLKKKKVYAIPRVQSALELFSSPTTSVLSEAHFIKHWKANAFVKPLRDDEISWIMDVPTGLPVSPVTSIQEELSGLEESPVSGIEILRAQSREISSEFEQSTGMDVTPDLPSLEKNRRSRDLSLSGEKRVDITTPARRVSRPPTVGRASILSPIIDEELEVEMIPLEEIDEPFSTDEEIPTEQRDEKTLETLGKIKRAMGDMYKVWFHDILHLNTPRKQAACIFYHLMALTKSGILDPVQRGPFEDILIKRGPAY
ncbi:uncharacterized protein LOC116293743 [Actinia tenebrosa]|uniref:Uncharacterized protein LOC116293743 n=1 Tax=Actinia tenebrosa TaxID=6105 RepID=A0A6P8HWU2_ACTTE|nr:uncharacterized protein LOC116293743 [Actinia tenebrosa]